MATSTEIVQRLREARRAAGFSQTEAAALIGLATSTLGDMEREHTPFPIDRMIELAEHYSTPLVWLVTGITPKFNAEMVYDVTKDALNLLEMAFEEMSSGKDGQ